MVFTKKAAGPNGQVATSKMEGTEVNIMNSIKEKVIVITGASSGLGEASARLLSEQGAIVVLGADV